MRILKFGGTSLQDADRMRTAVELVREARRQGPVAVVVSAMGGITDTLATAAAAMARGESAADASAHSVARRHREVARELAAPDEVDSVLAGIASQVQALEELLRGVVLVSECSTRTRDEILSFGERLAAGVLAAALRRAGIEAEACDARRILVTDDHFGSARVDEASSRTSIRQHFESHPAVQVVTGFTGATRSGRTTTLGRGGSDLTAAILGAALDADAIDIWTDVDGVMSADPRLVADAFPLRSVSYEELMELAHFGAKVIYPPTLHPARAGGIPLHIRNTSNPTHPGTTVVGHKVSREQPVCGISSIHHVALLRLEGDGMVGVPGVAARLFSALARADVSVVLISQASSEHSICCAVLPAAVSGARREIQSEFALERQVGLIDELIVEDELAVVAVVGEEMREQPGVAGRIFQVLGEESINIRAIAQGSSERNVSLVVAAGDEKQALNVIHAAFFPAATGAGSEGTRPAVVDGGGKAGRSVVGRTEPTQVFIIGAGQVGGALVDQIMGLSSVDTEIGGSTAGVPAFGSGRRSGAGLCIAAIARRQHLLLAVDAEVGGDWRARLEAGAVGAKADAAETVVAAVEAARGPRVLVDCTASDAVPALYARVLSVGASVVAANKRLFAGPLAAYQTARAAAAHSGVSLLHEATVGAGLPVLGTLRGLLESGDQVTRIEGVFSGSVAFLLGQLRRGVPLSSAVRDAADRGFTEPDPRDDLAGTDVARKLLILARLTGHDLELADIDVAPLVPDLCGTDASIETFWKDLPSSDAELAARQSTCAAAGRVLCYLACFDGGRARVALQELEADHPCAGLDGSDNLFAFTTRRYAASPLVIRGAGAGAQVTAAGVLSDILDTMTTRT